MSGSLNKVILIGNLGRDPELKVTPSGKSLCRFSIATTETWKDQSGEKQSKTEWHNIVIFGKQAELAEKFLTKGKSVLVEGKISYEEYTDKSGNKKTSTTIRAESFVMLGGRESTGASHRDDGGAPPPPAANGGFDNDIPF